MAPTFYTDPSITMRGMPPQENFSDTMMKLSQLAQSRRLSDIQAKEANLHLTELQRIANEGQAVRSATAAGVTPSAIPGGAPTIDNNKMLSTLAAGPNSYMVPGMQDQMATEDAAKKEAMLKVATQAQQLTDAQLTAAQKRMDMEGSMAQSVISNPASYPQAKAQAEQLGIIKPGTLPDQFTPDLIPHLQQLAQQAMSVKDILAQEETNRHNKATEAAAAGGGGGVDALEMKDWLAKNPGKGPADYGKYKATLVPSYNFNLQQNGSSGNAPLNSKQEATAQAILEGRMTPPSSFALKTPYWQNIMGSVFEKDPQFSEQRAELRKGFTVGKQSTEINDINTAMAHAGVLGDAIDNLKNTDMLAWNKIANAAGVQVGKDPVTTFNTIVHRLAPELAAAYGQGTGGERDKVESDLQASLGPTQLKKNLSATVGLIRGKIASFENQWNQNKSDSMPAFQDRFIMPQAKQTLDKWAPQGGGGSQISVTDPKGGVHMFPDQASADKFKALAGIK